MPNINNIMPNFRMHEEIIPEVFTDAQLEHGWNQLCRRHYDGIDRCSCDACPNKARFVFVDDNSITRYCAMHAYQNTDLSDQMFDKPDAHPIKSLIRDAI